MALDGELYGAGKLSPHSFCKDCNKPILDVSRTRKKLRCKICNEVRFKKILHIHSTRHSQNKKKETNTK
jgi:dihydroorotase